MSSFQGQLVFVFALTVGCLVGLDATDVSGDERDSSLSKAEGNGSSVIGPEYWIDPDLKDQGNPKGKYFEFTMRFSDIKIFKGDDSTL